MKEKHFLKALGTILVTGLLILAGCGGSPQQEQKAPSKPAH